MEPLVSIIMVTRNRGDYIGATIQSIREQTWPHWELIVMDDGSEDDTAGKMDTLQQADGRILYFKNPHTGITGILKNKAIRFAKGELLCFMDSDDIWPREKLRKQIEALQQYPEAGFSFTNGYNFRNRTREIEAWFYERKEGTACGDFFESVCRGETGIRLPTLMVWQRLLGIQNHFREDRSFTDFSFVTNLARQYKAVALYEPVFERRVHESNYSSDGWIADYEEHVETIERYRAEAWLSAAVADSILYKVYMNWGTTFMNKKRFAEARNVFFRAWLHNPLSLAPLKKIIRSIIAD